MSVKRTLSGLTGRPILLCQEQGVGPFRALWVGPSHSVLGRVMSAIKGERRSPGGLLADETRLRQGLTVAQARMNASFPIPAAASSVEWEHGYRLAEGIAFIDADGLLAASSYWEDHGYYDEYIQGYDALEGAFMRAAEDERVGAIMFRVESPGGDSARVFDLAGAIKAASARSGGKPVWAFTGRCALSAGYVLASSCDRVIASREACVGSIGAVQLHFDETGALEKAGVKVTAFTFGANKFAESGMVELTEGAREAIAARVQELGERFVAHVVELRGIDAAAILAQGADIYLADHTDPARSGLALGLVDAVMSESACFAALRAVAAGEADPIPSTAPAATPSPVSADATPEPEAIAAAAARARPATQMATQPMSGETDMDAQAVAALQAKMQAEGKTPEEILAAIMALVNEEEDQPAAAAGQGEDEQPAAAAAALAATAPVGALSGAALGVAIGTLPEAKGREAFAATLAEVPGMTLELAKARLAAQPVAGPGFPAGAVPPDPAVTAASPSKPGGAQASSGAAFVNEVVTWARGAGFASRLRETT